MQIRTAVLFFTIVIFCAVSAYAETVIADLVVNGEKIAEPVTFEGEDMSLSDPITLGKCTSKNLNDFGKVNWVKKPDGDSVEITLKEECYAQKEISLARAEKCSSYNKSSSFFLNFSVTNINTKENNATSLFSGVGAFLGKVFLYSDANLDFEQNEFTRNNSYLGYEDIKNKLNFKVGDIFSSSDTMFIQSKPLMGLNIKRDYSIDPTVKPYNSLSRTLTLVTRSTVEIYKDNTLIQRHTLPPGVYDFNDIPIESFAGELTIKIKDIYGNERIEKVPYSISRRNLKKGYDDFSLSGGFERKDSGDKYRDFRTIGYYHRGITDILTMGVSFGDKISPGGVISVPKVGIFWLEKLVDRGGSLTDNFSMGYEYSSRNFSFNANNYKKDGENNITTNTGITLPARLGSLNLRTYLNDDKKAALAWSTPFPLFKNSNIYIDAAHSRNAGESIYFNILKNFKNSLLNFSYSYDRKQHNKLYVSFEIFLDRKKYTAWGGKISVNSRRDDTRIETELKGKHGMFTSINNVYYTQDNQRITTSRVSGSYACAFSEGNSQCKLGESIIPEQSFVAGKTVIYNNIKNNTVPVLPHQPQRVSIEKTYTIATHDVCLRKGQGYPVSPDKIAVTGKLLKNGKPFALKEFEFAGEKHFTSSFGEFFVESTPYLEGIDFIIDGTLLRFELKNKDSEVIDLGEIDIERR